MRITQNIRLKLIIFSLMLFTFTVSIGIVFADTRYVTDELIITMREGKGNEYKIIKTYKAGTPFEIIEDSGNYLKVRTKSGKEGWVLKQYVTRKTPKPVVIANQKKQIDLLNTKIEQYKKDNELLQDELTTAKSESNIKIKDLTQNVSASKGTADQTAKELKKITKKYSALLKNSKDVINIVKERDSLKESNSSFQAMTEQLQQETDKLKQTQMIWWFVAGGGVLFVGWIIGKLSRQKRFY